MKFLEAKNTARRLFGNVELRRNSFHRCIVVQNGKAIGDGHSWLEALRSAGEFQMLRNDLEAKRIKVIVDEYAKMTGIDASKPLTAEQLEAFDKWADGRT